MSARRCGTQLAARIDPERSEGSHGDKVRGKTDYSESVSLDIYFSPVRARGN